MTHLSNGPFGSIDISRHRPAGHTSDALRPAPGLDAAHGIDIFYWI
jgi:hypothetical protein